MGVAMFGPPQNDRIKGVLERVRFASADGSFAVCELRASGHPLPVTMVGNILSAQPGESVEVEGQWIVDPRWGKQFKIGTLRVVLPVTEDGIIKYLSGGFIKGIGPELAKRIVGQFGADTLDLLDEQPERLQEVGGIGKVRAQRIMSAWAEQRTIRHVMVFLQSHGVSPAYAVRIYRQYGPRAADIVQANPYRLAEDIFGIGFKKADQIATELGIRHDAIERLRAGLLYTLGQAQSAGHMYLPWHELQAKAAALLGVDADLLGAAYESLRMSRDLIIEPTGEEGVAAVYLEKMWRAEIDAARHLRRLAQATAGLNMEVDEELVARAEAVMGVALAPAQREAVAAVWDNKVTVITGGPGTGKTTLVRAVVALGEAAEATIALAAPTGRAAKRLSESTGRDARTLHRLLQFSFQAGGFQVNEESPLEVDLLIVDEASMLDTALLGAVVRALPDEARLLLVGDVDQLPSVGPGNVLSDIIASQAVRVVRLTEIFRQAQESFIVVNAHRINSGEMPIVPPTQKGKLVDFYTIKADDPAAARARIIELVTRRLPDAFGFDPIEDLQILSPMRRGAVGCEALNELLQAQLHPPGTQEIRVHGRVWKLGDKVMQTRNNYEMDVFNGDVGRITALLPAEELVRVRFDDRELEYDLSQLDELQLAYAVTVHKSQGSEYPVVILPMVTQHYVMLQRNLLYTGVTRARRVVLLVGTEKAVGLAVRAVEARQRYTRLVDRLASARPLPVEEVEAC